MSPRQNMKSLRTRAGSIVLTLVCLSAMALTVNAEQFRSARVTRIIKDVRLLPTQATPRAAAVNDEVSAGTAVRTGVDSRTELTFADLTLTRLGANSIFTFNEGTRQVDLGGGAVLVQVPRNGADMKIVTAAVTAAVSGGVALFETHKTFPTKLLMLEGIGRFYPTGHPEQALIVHGGEMAMMTLDGQMTRPAKFDAAKVYNTSLLIQDFPTLANADLIFQVIDQQQAEIAQALPNPTPPRDPIDQTDQAIAAVPPAPSGPDKFGKPPVILSPDPYVMSSGTQINTDPTITTNGITDLGKIYRGPAADGSEFDYLFDSTSAFDTAIGTFFNGNGNGVPVAVFKFSHLQLSGDPIVTIPGGATTFLGFVSVGDITLGAPGGTLTFAGAQRVFFATQAGSINFDSSVAFSGISHLTFYARGAGSNLTLGSPISGSDVVHLDAEGAVRINGNITASDEFKLFSGGDFLSGPGVVTAPNVDIESLSNINFNPDAFPDVAGGSLILSAAGTLDVAVTGGTYGRDSLVAEGMTINLNSAAVVTLDFLNATASFTAGTGGINAPNIDFTGAGVLDFVSGGNVTAHSITSAGLTNGTIAANGGALNLTGDLVSGAVSALTDIDVGGNVTVQSLDAGGTITAGGELRAFGAINAGGDITADTVSISGGGITTAGNLIAGSGGIHPFVVSPGGAAVQATAAVATITSPNGIDFSGNQFQGIDGLSSGGRLTVNASSLTFDPAAGVASANFNGADSGAFGPGSPSDGGDGGVFVVNATGDITANAGADIMATTGLNSAGGVFSGAGGSVTLQSSAGTVTVNDTIQVSSDDAPAQRQSASGGNITVTSGKDNGVAISVSNSGQLLALLNTVAPGPGGTITIMATSPTSNSTVNINGTVQADRGTVDIEHAGGGGQINLNNATLRADIVKVGAFGANGSLIISSGTLSADTTLKLYAPGSNGQIIFVSNCSIGGGTATILAGNAVTINGGVMVNVTGHRADVFVNSTSGIPNANYAGASGGNNSTTGTFTGAGANNPQPLSGAPGF